MKYTEDYFYNTFNCEMLIKRCYTKLDDLFINVFRGDRYSQDFYGMSYNRSYDKSEFGEVIKSVMKDVVSAYKSFNAENMKNVLIKFYTKYLIEKDYEKKDLSDGKYSIIFSICGDEE